MVRVDVFAEMMSAEEGHLAVGAAVRANVLVAHQVHFQLAFQCVPLPTHVAAERLFRGVRQHVALKKRKIANFSRID